MKFENFKVISSKEVTFLDVTHTKYVVEMYFDRKRIEVNFRNKDVANNFLNELQEKIDIYNKEFKILERKFLKELVKEKMEPTIIDESLIKTELKIVDDEGTF